MQKKGFSISKSKKGVFHMTEESKNRMKLYFEKLMENLEDGVIHEIPLVDGTDAKDGS